MLKKQYLKNKAACLVSFSLPAAAASAAEEVRLLGDFNQWNWEQAPVLSLEDDVYHTMLELETGRRYEFRYLADGRHWINDWVADAYVPSPFDGADNCVLDLTATDSLDSESAEAAPKAAKTKAKPEGKSARGKNPAKAEPAAEAKPEQSQEKPAMGGRKRSGKTDTLPAEPKADDLKRIEGIGPKIEELLNARGINTFAGLSNASIATLRDILKEAGSRYRMHDPSSWMEQASLAQDGQWEQLSQLQAMLRGGKKK